MEDVRILEEQQRQADQKLEKAKQYKEKNGNDVSSSALHMAVGLAKDKYPMVIR